MTKINTAERVSAEASDNFVFQRSLLAYHAAAERIAGDVLEIGTGSGYGIEVVAPRARRFVTVDKHVPAPKLLQLPNVEFRQAEVPPLDFPDGSFDCVISFQVIEHIRRDGDFVREIARVLRPGGRFIVTTPNAPMSLTRNPWHVREYTAEELRRLLAGSFSTVETLGVFGDEKVMDYYEENRRSVRRRRNTPSQTLRSRRDRARNVEGAFAVRHPERLAGRHVLLVDDVMTTGNTLLACAAEILRAAPGCRVSIAAFAVSRREMGVKE